MLGSQPLDVLHDTTGDLMAVFLGSHAICPRNKSPFSELRCEVGEDQFPAVRRQLDAMDIARRRPVGETAGRQVLNDLIARQTRRLEQLARKHKARAKAEAAESASRLAFDPGAAADKVRRYEDASIRRMTRACEDLVKLRRSGIFDEDPLEEAELPIPARGREPRLEHGSRDDISEFARWKPPRSGEDGESSAHAERTDDDAPPPMSMSMSISKPALDGPRSHVDGLPPTVNGERPATSEKTDIASDAPPEESGFPSAAQASQTAVHGPRSLLPGNSGPWSILLLLVCFWWFVGSGRPAALRGNQLPSFQEEHHAERDDYPEEHHAERDDYSDRLTVAAPAGTTRGQSIQITLDDSGRASLPARPFGCPSPRRLGRSLALPRSRKPIQTGERRPTRGEPAARNEATAIGSDSAESSGRVGSALTRQGGRLILGRVVGFTDSERPSVPFNWRDQRLH